MTDQYRGLGEVLESFENSFDRMKDASRYYLEQIQDERLPDVEPGNFYETLNKSIVYVARLNECNCPFCSGQSGGLGDVFGMLLGQHGERDEADEAMQEHRRQHQTSEGPYEYVAVVIKGGHDSKALKGNQPGDVFVLHEKGVIPELLDPSRVSTELSAESWVSVAGMSVRRRLDVQFQPVEEAADAS